MLTTQTTGKYVVIIAITLSLVANRTKKEKKTTMNKRLSCSYPLNEVFNEGVVTDSRLKYNILCKFTNDTIDNLSVKPHLSTRCIDKSITV